MMPLRLANHRLQLPAFAAACMLAAVVPMLPPSQADRQRAEAEAAAAEATFPGWPTSFEGKPLQPAPMQLREAKYYRGFPGKISKFSDGDRQIIIRWVSASTRQFHLTTRCFRAIGYDLTPLAAYKDSNGNTWGSFRAVRGSEALTVREQITDAQGRSWSDESAWRWDLFWRRTSGPWWAYTIAQKQ